MKVAIASGKGGTGKTTLSVNLALYLSESMDVVLADFDVEEPNSGIFLDGRLTNEIIAYKMIPKWKEDKCTLCNLCQKVCNFNAIIQMTPMIIVFPELCHSCYACSDLCPEDALPMEKTRMGVIKQITNRNFNFVEGRLDIGQEQAVPLIKQTHSYLKSNFNSGTLMIIDSPPGTSCPVIETAKDSDYVILVTEPTPFGLNDLILAIDTMKQMKKQFGVVINRYGTGNGDLDGYCENNNINIIGRINDNIKVAELYSKGEIVYTQVEGFKNSIKEIAGQLQSIYL